MSRQRRAFTLLEVVLTLALSVALMLLVGGAMQFYGRTMTVNDMDIRLTQLASAVIQMIEDDLRSTLYSRPVDNAAFEAMLAAAAGQELKPQEDLSAAGIDSESEPDTASDGSLFGTTVLQSPGLIGSQYQIQFDLSRLPRLEEYVTMLDETAADLDDLPSDIKTVSYYVQQPGVIGGVRDTLDSLLDNRGVVAGGLVRRSLDRAVTVEASITGGLSQLNQTGEVIAPEVVGIEFSYWDGTAWLLQWNSDEYAELPMAIQVELTMNDPVAAAANDQQGIPATGAVTRTFRHVIRMPMARPIDTSASGNELEEAGL